MGEVRILYLIKSLYGIIIKLMGLPIDKILNNISDGPKKYFYVTISIDSINFIS